MAAGSIPPSERGPVARAAPYLATGFAGLDRAGDVGAFADCLRLLDRFPGMRAIKDESVTLLRRVPGARILEAGCGLGGEARIMAGMVGPAGTVVGLDASRSILCRARARPGPPVAWLQGDLARLPFTDATYDACRVERVLQHLPDPQAAVFELARVVRPGGLVLALEPDWGTFAVDSALRETTRTVTEAWCDSFASGWVGRQLAGYLDAAGLAGIEVRPRTLLVRRLAEAEAIYNLFVTVDRAVAAGRLSAREAALWRSEQEGADARGRFFASLTFFLVTGTRPER